MATVTPTTQAQWAAAVQNAANGDIVRLPAGAQFNGVRITGRNNLTIRSADPANPGTINNEMTVTNCQNLTIEDVKLVGSQLYAAAPNWNGLPIPGGIGLRCDRVSGLKVRRCELRFWRIPISLKGDTAQSNILIEWNDFRQIGMDGIVVQAPTTGLTVQRNSFAGEQIHGGIYRNKNEHPDCFQSWLNGASPAHQNFVFEDNHFELFRQKALWFGPGTSPMPYTINGLTIRRNWARSGRFLVFALNYVENALVEENTIKGTATRPPERAEAEPALAMGDRLKNITVRNNIIPRAIPWYTATKLADVVGTATFENNVVRGINDTTVAGPEVLVPGQNCGRVVVGEAVPAQPTIATEHGQFQPGLFDDLGGGQFTRVMIVKTGSFAFGASGQPAEKIQWRRPSAGITAWQSFAAAGVTNAGSRRLHPMLDGAVYAMGYGATQPGMEWRYQLPAGTLWSAPSSYLSDASAAPDAPVIPTLPGLTLPAWDIPGYRAVSEGHFAPLVRTVPGAPAPAFMQWTPDNGTTWLPTLADGPDAAGRTLWLLQPAAPGGQEHIVPYAGTLAFAVRYNDGATMSDISVDAKTFTAPAAPDLPPGFEPGDRLHWDGDQITILRRRLRLGPANMPSAVSFLDVSVADGVISIETQAAPPAGAVRMEAIYGGHAYPLVDGGASFPLQSGFSVVSVRGVSADDVGGREMFRRITADTDAIGLADDGAGGWEASTAPDSYGLINDGAGGWDWAGNPHYRFSRTNLEWESA
ncbi:MAG: hypothetical protein KA745_00170 [Gemmatimonadales bacterium]|nr:hypothetical protein [Gemmatimonadales bacterium]